MRRARVLPVVLLFVGWVCALPTAGQKAEPGKVDRGAVVLDTTSVWRLHHTLKPLVIELDEGLKPILVRQWLDRETPEPPAQWRLPEFDDSTWVRGPARILCRTPYLSRLCMRGYFRVTDPAKVKGLADPSFLQEIAAGRKKQGR